MKLPADPKAAVLGLGIIGSRVHANLRNAGLTTSCWNRSPKKAPEASPTAREAVADADLISLFLKDSPALRAVMEEIECCLRPNQVVMNHSTIDPATARWTADLCDRAGCGFLDAPFTGSREAAANRQLVYYVSGPRELAETVDDFLALTSSSRLFCGPVGSAAVVKLVTNLLAACTVQALAEALAIATAHGVSADLLARAIADNASGSRLAAMKLPLMATGDFEPHFSLENMAKDAGYVARLAADAGLPAPATLTVARQMQSLIDQGMGPLDYSVLAEGIRGNP
jgi:3-hydroxyisobutyrate dehydrogenase-like beta-hydroxyacid dehydrogenase